MRRYLYTFLLLTCAYTLKAQQYGLFNTKTLFDAFENPAQKAFTLDSSRQYASNFLFPYLDLSSLNKGDSDNTVLALVKNGYQQSRNGAFNNPRTTREEMNIYLVAFRMFAYHKYHSEMGFSWQIRSHTKTHYDKDISLGNFETFDKIATIPRINIFNNNSQLQLYHQISFNYRENYTKRWSLGAKISLLTGIGYTEFNATESDVTLNNATQQMSVKLKGDFKLNYPDDDITLGKLLPFKNLGASITLGSSYTSPTGLFVMANVKDLGFIRWAKKKSAQGQIDVVRDFNDINNEVDVYKAMYKIGEAAGTQKAFISPINSRADLLISKTFHPYTPSLILTKNIFDNYGEIALVNTLKSNNFSMSISPTYNTDKNFRLGLQMMHKTPNFEIFLGTNDIIKTYYTGRELNNEIQSTGYDRGSVYLGMAFKIGYIVEHPQNMSWMPNVKNAKERNSFFRNFFNTLQFWKKR